MWFRWFFRVLLFQVVTQRFRPFPSCGDAGTWATWLPSCRRAWLCRTQHFHSLSFLYVPVTCLLISWESFFVFSANNPIWCHVSSFYCLFAYKLFCYIFSSFTVFFFPHSCLFPANSTFLSHRQSAEERKTISETEAFWILVKHGPMSLSFLLVLIVVCSNEWIIWVLMVMCYILCLKLRGLIFFSIYLLCLDWGMIWTDSAVPAGVWMHLDPDCVRCLFCAASFPHLWFQMMMVKFCVWSWLVVILWAS